MQRPRLIWAHLWLRAFVVNPKAQRYAFKVCFEGRLGQQQLRSLLE